MSNPTVKIMKIYNDSIYNKNIQKRVEFEVELFELFYFSVGVLMNAYCHNFWLLLLASGVFLGPAQSLMDVTSMTAVYHYFLDEHVYLFTSIVSSGVGGGMIVFSVIFFMLEPKLG